MPDKQGENSLPSVESKESEIKRRSEKLRLFLSDPATLASDQGELSEFIELSDTDDVKSTAIHKEKKIKLLDRIMMLHNLKNGFLVSSLSYPKYCKTLTEMRRRVAEDYDCKTSLESMLADRIVANYWRAMRNDTLLNHYIENEDGSFSYNQLKVNAIREFNRGIDRADRQLNADIILLKELKQPKLNIKVSAETAYIAQNQQVVNPTKNSERTASSESLEADDLGKK
jgi:hypothetical protein